MKRKILPYNPKLKHYAKELRRSMTLAEVLLWNQLKRRRIQGYDFDRQRPIGEYIVDFYCKELRLAIEVDGKSHDFRQAEDTKRQEVLEGIGVRFIRFWEQDVKHDMESVVGKIEAWIAKHGEPTPRFADPSKEGNLE